MKCEYCGNDTIDELSFFEGKRCCELCFSDKTRCEDIDS